MLIKCTESKQYPSLTTNKEYKLEAIVASEGIIYVTDDNKEVRGFSFELFENIEVKGL